VWISQRGTFGASGGGRARCAAVLRAERLLALSCWVGAAIGAMLHKRHNTAYTTQAAACLVFACRLSGIHDLGTYAARAA
jgi:hypothetical protein